MKIKSILTYSALVLSLTTVSVAGSTITANADQATKETKLVQPSAKKADSSSSDSTTVVSDTASDNVNSSSDDKSGDTDSSSNEKTSDTDNTSAFKTPFLAYGGGLTAKQLEETKQDLGVTDNNSNNSNDTYKSQAVQGADVDNYLHMNGVQTSGLFSSVYISRSSLEGQNNVKIVTPDNITMVTKAGYETPLLTAGISNLDVKVASADSVGKVSGQSALAGVYKALEAEGITVNKDRAKVAQDELNTTSQIVNNQGGDNMSYKDKSKLDTQLASALANIKTQLADKKGQDLSEADLEKIVDQGLKDAQLDPNDFNSDDKQAMTKLAKTYIDNKDTVLDKKSVENYKKYADNVAKTLQDKYGISVDSAKGFFAKIWDWFKGLFN